jgi:hypothetical protein
LRGGKNERRDKGKTCHLGMGDDDSHGHGEGQFIAVLFLLFLKKTFRVLVDVVAIIGVVRTIQIQCHQS